MFSRRGSVSHECISSVCCWRVLPVTCVVFCCQVFDHNSDGYISKLELHKTMNELGIELSREDLDAMMDQADVNKDGRIDYAGT